MNIGQHIITNILTEKASIDWNNYLTPEEVNKFLSKDDKVESAEEIVYDTKGNFYQKYFDSFKDEGWTKRELTQDLANFYHKGHLNESIDKLWISQMSKKSDEELSNYLDKLYKKLAEYNDKEIKSTGFYQLLDKINYLEDILGIKPKLGRVLK